jgi:hypothetical protein
VIDIVVIAGPKRSSASGFVKISPCTLVISPWQENPANIINNMM